MITSKLISSCAKGNTQAQLELYRLYSGAVYNSAYRVVGNSQEAEEIMQDTFLKFFDQAATYIELGSRVEFVLRRIAVNAAIDVARRRKQIFVEVEQMPVTAIDDDEPLDVAPNIDRVTEIIEGLPQRQRALLSLRFKEGMSHREIAEQFEVSESAVKMLFARVKKRILILYNKV